MEDLSYLFADGPVAALYPDSQGNRFSARDAAASAPGSETTASAAPDAADVLPENHGKPRIEFGRWNTL